MHRSTSSTPRQPPTARFLSPVLRLLLLAFCLLLLPAACAPQPIAVTRKPVTMRLVAADSCASLAEDLVAAYQEAHPWVTVHVEIFNNSKAQQMLRSSEADVALLSWLEEGESALWSRPFARDGIAVIAHPATPFEETGLAHLQDIFRGRIQEWEGMVLTVVSREEGSGTRAAFDGAVLGGRDTTLTAVAMPSSEAVVEHVRRTPGAIGYVSTLRLEDSGIRVLPVEGISPTRATIADGSYPLSRSLLLATLGEPDGEAREFAQWVLGPEGQAIVER